MRKDASKIGTVAIYQLKINLENIRPPIWRRVQVPGAILLPHLHHLIQTVMGWEDAHLHAFRVGDTSYGQLDSDLDDWMQDERRIRLTQIAPAEKSKFRYEYDFGDDWRHLVVVEKILPAEVGQIYPVCLGGNVHVHRRTVEVDGDIPSFWRRSRIPSMSNTTSYWNGSAESLILKRSMWQRSIQNCERTFCSRLRDSRQNRYPVPGRSDVVLPDGSFTARSQNVGDEHLDRTALVVDCQIPGAIQQGIVAQSADEIAGTVKDQQGTLLDGAKGAIGGRNIAHQHKTSLQHTQSGG